MELIHVTHKASKFARQDFISNMPDNVITHILDRLPIQEAVRTGILARDWRFKWTMLTQLVFDELFSEYLEEKDVEKYRGMIISRLLLHLKGPITKFDLYTDYQCFSIFDVEDINNWVMFLSTKGIKDLTLINRRKTPLKLHSHLFSCLELNHLVLINCCFRPMPNFHGFSNLLSLDVDAVTFESYECGEFLTRSPLLEILKIGSLPMCVIKGDEIAKLENLKVLSLPLYLLDNMTITSSSIFQLIGCFSKPEELTLDFLSCELSADDSKRVPSTFPCLKTLILDRIDSNNEIMLSCAFDLICGSPNLQTLKIVAIYSDEILQPELCFSEVDFNRMGQLQLREVVLEYIGGSENEIWLIKSLLASSPFLKRMCICASSSKVLDSDGVRIESITHQCIDK